MPPPPAFHPLSARDIQGHVSKTLAFYRAHAFDARGGFFHYLMDDGSVYNRDHRHIVSATRYVVNWSLAYRSSGESVYFDWAQHAWTEVQRFRLESGLYAWTMNAGEIEDASVLAYAQAFALLAHAHAYRLGLCRASELSAFLDKVDSHFYEAQHHAYSDEISPSGQHLQYRGQNANMHMCEALLLAYEVSHEEKYLERAIQLIERFPLLLAQRDTATHGLLWEHYDTQWRMDWDYNRNNRDNIFKPWGFQVGHQTEWAKLLLIAYRYNADRRWLERAAYLHQQAMLWGWDSKHGGLVYSLGPHLRPCDSNKYFWVQAESLASAWRLWRLKGEPAYLNDYMRIWDWAWQHMVDHEYGAWFRILSAEGNKLEQTKSPAGKVDYHTLGACWDILAVGGLEA